MKIVIRTDPDTRQFWKSRIADAFKEAEVFLWDEDEFSKDEIDFAIVWSPPGGMLASLKNLRAVFSVGAGISHITVDPTLPKSLPIIRTTGEVLRRRMCEYIALHVLRIHRRLPEIESASRLRKWRWIVEPTADSKTIGIMGFGNLGYAAAKCLRSLGYNVKGLVKTPRDFYDFEVYEKKSMGAFLKNVDILICMLPGTEETENIICKETLNQLPKGSWIINVGRGSHVNDSDLIEALDNGQIAGAVLDVFRTEPLPPDHPFWGHEEILITSHTASAIEAMVGTEIIANNIRKFMNGEKIADLVDLAKGY
jgi:glyoxylate/hydroxypyruvate reductase A